MSIRPSLRYATNVERVIYELQLSELRIIIIINKKGNMLRAARYIIETCRCSKGPLFDVLCETVKNEAFFRGCPRPQSLS